MDCCAVKDHLVIVGGGSAAFAAAIRARELGAKATIINDRLPIGGTCVNVGCVPSKTLIRAAEAHYRSAHHHFAGIRSSSAVEDFSAIIGQKRELVEELRRSKYVEVISGLEDVEFIEGRARLLSATRVVVGDREVSGTRILIASGASPDIPAIPGLAESGYLTNETAFELEELPQSLIVLGGRYIALETAQLFARLGSRVTILQRSDRILPTETADLTAALTGFLEDEGISVQTGIRIEKVARRDGQVVVHARQAGEERDFRATHLIAATGRKPNTANMGLAEIGIELDERGYLRTDRFLQTSLPGVYGAGDVNGRHQFVYTAAYEGKLAAENALSAQPVEADYTALPWVIFTDPQVAGVGLDEQQAQETGLTVDVAVLPLSHLPRALAARDTRGFIKLIRERHSDKLVGARILAPEGGELLMEAALAIKFGITVSQIVSMFHPYLTLSEGIKLTAIAFDKEVSELSCCAT